MANRAPPTIEMTNAIGPGLRIQATAIMVLTMMASFWVGMSSRSATLGY